MKFKDAVIHIRRAPKPAGWKTIHEVAAELGCCAENASRKLKKLKEAGIVEDMRWIVYDDHGRAAPSKLFRVVKK